MSEKRWTVLNTTILIIVGYLLLRSDGLVGARLSTWSHGRQVVRLVRQYWPALREHGRYYAGAAPDPPHFVIFTDYECPFCKKLHAVLATLHVSHPEIVITYRNLPLPIHPGAPAAARAAICAGEQGRFVNMHTYLFEVDDWRQHPNWLLAATQVGIRDTVAFVNCLTEPRTRESISRDSSLAQALGVTGTPAIFTSRGMVEGALPDSALLALLR